MVCSMCNVQLPVATMGVEFLAGLTGFVFVCNIQVPVVRIGAGLYAGWTGFVFVCNVQVPVVRIGAGFQAGLTVCACVSCTGVNGQVHLGAGFQAGMTLMTVCSCVMYRCHWSGTAGGRISGWVDTNDGVFVCHVQVSMVGYSWGQDFRLLLAHRHRE